jgi:HD-GYP domain-containing protein (c-di-GMP phosphodiesterase class II)
MSLEATRALVYAIDKKDQYTSGHSQRVGFMARITGETMGLPMAELDQLEWSGLLHDIGKIGVPEEILNKPGKLTDEEFDEIKKHPQMGYDILAPIKAFEHILGGVLSHHENEDGSGYPHGLAGDEIPMFARIIHVVDVFDALSSTRSYRKAFTVDKAMDIVLELAEAKMYPPAVSAFKAALDDFRYLQPDAFRAMFYFALADTNDADAGEETSE